MPKGNRGGKYSISSRALPSKIRKPKAIKGNPGGFERTGKYVSRELVEAIGDKRITIEDYEIVINKAREYQHVVLNHPTETMREEALERWPEAIENPNDIYFDRRHVSLVYIKFLNDDRALVTPVNIGKRRDYPEMVNASFASTWITSEEDAKSYSDENHKGRYMHIYSKG